MDHKRLQRERLAAQWRQQLHRQRQEKEARLVSKAQVPINRTKQAILEPGVVKKTIQSIASADQCVYTSADANVVKKGSNSDGAKMKAVVLQLAYQLASVKKENGKLRDQLFTDGPLHLMLLKAGEELTTVRQELEECRRIMETQKNEYMRDEQIRMLTNRAEEIDILKIENNVNNVKEENNGLYKTIASALNDLEEGAVFQTTSSSKSGDKYKVCRRKKNNKKFAQKII